LKPTSHQNSTPTVPGATPKQAVVEVGALLYRGALTPSLLLYPAELAEESAPAVAGRVARLDRARQQGQDGCRAYADGRPGGTLPGHQSDQFRLSN
jgi:hypothetical protein